MGDRGSIRRGADRGAVPVAGSGPAWPFAELAYLRRLGGVGRAVPAGSRRAAVACLVELLSSPSEQIALAAAQVLAQLDGADRTARRRELGREHRDETQRTDPDVVRGE